MVTGMCVYLLFANVQALNPAKPLIYTLIGYLTPSLIFAQLLLTFCKISPHELLPTPWHGWLLLFQTFATCALAAALLLLPRGGNGLLHLSNRYRGSGDHG